MPKLALGGLLLLLSLWFGLNQAIQPILMLGTAVAAAALSWKFARFWLVATPIAIVAGDLYLDTGALLVQEREILLLALIGGRVAAKDCDYWVPKSAYLQWLPFFALLLVAGVQGFVSLPVALPVDELSTYASHHNPIRILLAYGIGVLLFPLAQHAFAGTHETRGKNWIAFSTGK